MNDKRFEELYSQDNFVSHTKILVDRQTGVQYLFVQQGYAGGLTPLLGADGRPLTAAKEQP